MRSRSKLVAVVAGVMLAILVVPIFAWLTGPFEIDPDDLVRAAGLLRRIFRGEKARGRERGRGENDQRRQGEDGTQSANLHLLCSQLVVRRFGAIAP